jgi:hypothetical protein
VPGCFIAHHFTVVRDRLAFGDWYLGKQTKHLSGTDEHGHQSITDGPELLPVFVALSSGSDCTEFIRVDVAVMHSGELISFTAPGFTRGDAGTFGRHLWGKGMRGCAPRTVGDDDDGTMRLMKNLFISRINYGGRIRVRGYQLVEMHRGPF